jgi:glycolate oxidase FAD binding subunit
MSVAGRSLRDALAAIAGGEGVRDDEGTRARFALDGVVPRWVVRPAGLAELARVVALASDAGLAVAARGSGSALALGRPPARADLVLDLTGLDRIVEYNPDDLTVTVEAGVTVGALAHRLAGRRQLLALDPPGAGARTLGGIAATGASGPLRARYGTIRDLLLGVRFVQADGVPTWGGAKVVKSVSGYDVPKLMVGSLGTLGVLGELTLRLHPAPDAEGTWLIPCRDAAAAQEVVLGLIDSAVQPSRVEVMNGAALAACGIAEGPAAVAVSIGTAEDAVRAQGETLAALGRAAGGAAREAGDGFWARYERAMAPAGGVRLAVGTLASRLAETLVEVERAAGASLAGVAPAITGCAPLGNLRVWLPVAEAGAIGAVVERLRAFVAPAGGSVIIQHAPPEVRAAVDPWGPIEPGPFALMRALKEAFDPKGVLSPGRFVGGL